MAGSIHFDRASRHIKRALGKFGWNLHYRARLYVEVSVEQRRMRSRSSGHAIGAASDKPAADAAVAPLREIGTGVMRE